MGAAMGEDGDMTPSSGPPSLLNGVVDALIAGGRYQEALSLPDRFAVRGPRVAQVAD